MSLIKTRVNPNGRLVIPAELRQQLNLTPNQEVFVSQENGVIQITSVHLALARVRNWAQKYRIDPVTLSDEPTHS